MQIRKRGAGRAGMPGWLGHYASVLLYVLIISLLYAVALLPLAALFLFDQGMRYLALLSPLLILFVLMPLRFSFAQALINRYRGIPFSLQAAFDFSLYGEKLAEGIVYLLHMLKWVIPLIACSVALYYMYDGGYEFTQTIITLSQLGKTATSVWNSFANFFIAIFGGTQLTAAGGIAEAFLLIDFVLGLCVLLIIWGLVRNSAYRYIWAGATQLDKNPRFEARRSLRERRGKQLLIALLNLILLLPAIVLLEPKGIISDIAMRYAESLAAETALPVVIIPYGKLAIVFFVCYLPLLPLRRIITAHFATVRIRQLMLPPQVATNTNATPVPPLYQDNPPASKRN